MEDHPNRALINELARDILAEVAPNEMPIFPAVSAAYFKDPEAAVRKARSKNSILGFGMDSTTFLTPEVLHILSEVFIFLTAVATEAVKHRLADSINEAFTLFWEKLKRPGHNQQCQLTDEQISRVREIALETAKLLRLPPARANLLADAIIDQLASKRE